MSDDFGNRDEDGNEGQVSGTGDVRPWWKKKRFIIPIALVLVVAALTSGGDDDEELATEDDEDTVEEEDGEPDEGDDQEDDVADDEPQEAEEPSGEEESEQPEDDEPEEDEEPESPDFDPVTLEGSGDDVVDVPVVDDVALVATIEHSGSGNFVVQSYDEGGDTIDLLVNVIGAYQGTVPYNFQVSPAELEINADGPWTVTIAPLLDQPVLEDDADGSGDEVLLLANAGRLAVTHEGDGNFVLQAWGDARDLLVNEIGTYEGTVRLPDAIALEINADGAWTLAVG